MFEHLERPVADKARQMLPSVFDMLREIDPEGLLTIVWADPLEWQISAAFFEPEAEVLGWALPRAEGDALRFVVCPEQIAGEIAQMLADELLVDAQVPLYLEAIGELAWLHRDTWRQWPDMDFDDRSRAAWALLGESMTAGPKSPSKAAVIDTVSQLAVEHMFHEDPS